jgi:hypothetical protein
VVARLWNELTTDLHEDCRWVVHGVPTLVHPRSGIVFGFCSGTLTYALRLPLSLFTTVVAKGAKTYRDFPAYPEAGIEASRLDLVSIGHGWVFGRWDADEVGWCTAAFQRAGGAAKPKA